MTVVGLSTLLLGGAYAAFGGWLIFAGAAMDSNVRADDPVGGFAFLLRFLAGFIIVIGVAFLPPGILGLLAGSGALLRKQWGRVLTFILAGLTILLGLLWVAGGDQDATDIAVGAGQILYGIFAFVILIKHGAEFSRPRLLEA